MIELICFIFGLLIGLFLNMIIGIIKYYIYMKNKKMRRKVFKKKMDDLME